MALIDELFRYLKSTGMAHPTQELCAVVAPKSEAKVVHRSLTRLLRRGMVEKDIRRTNERGNVEAWWSIAPRYGASARIRRMDPRRANFTWKVRIGCQPLYVTCDVHSDGALGAIHMDMAKAGSALLEWTKRTADLFNTALKHGTPLEALIAVFAGSHSLPCGAVECHPTITSCSSVLDFVAQLLTEEFVRGNSDRRVPEHASEDQAGSDPPEERGP